MREEMVIGLEQEKRVEPSEKIQNEVGKYVINQQKMIVEVYYDQHGSTYLDSKTLIGLGADPAKFKIDPDFGLYEVSKEHITQLINNFKDNFPSVDVEVERKNIIRPENRLEKEMVIDNDPSKYNNIPETNDARDQAMLEDMLNTSDGINDKDTNLNDFRKL